MSSTGYTIGFLELLVKLRPEFALLPKRLLVLDPGETLGWAFFVDGKLASYGQEKVDPEMSVLRNLFKATNPSYVVAEEYIVYSWKASAHSWSTLSTTKLLGAIQLLCKMYEVPFVVQTAGVPKSFCHDERLKSWGMYFPKLRHANDAIRHGAYFLLFRYGKKGVPSSS